MNNFIKIQPYISIGVIYSCTGKEELVMIHMPFVVEKGVQNDIVSRLLEDRIIMLHDQIDEVSAQMTIMQLLYLDSISNEPIKLYINSVGGVCTDGLAIIDTMRIIKSPVHTISMGLSASMGALILTQGDKRFALPNAEIMVHQPLGGAYGQATDIAIQADNILKMKHKLTKMLADNSLMTYEEMELMCDRDTYLSADEALELGLIDKIIEYTEK